MIVKYIKRSILNMLDWLKNYNSEILKISRCMLKNLKDKSIKNLDYVHQVYSTLKFEIENKKTKIAAHKNSITICKLDRISKIGHPFPYGHINKLPGQDGDFFDCIIVSNSAQMLAMRDLTPGVRFDVKPIGIINMTDGRDIDDKIIAVPVFKGLIQYTDDCEIEMGYRLSGIINYLTRYKDFGKKLVEDTIKITGFITEPSQIIDITRRIII